MAQIPDAIAQSVEQFLRAVRDSRRVEAAYLYGSHAKGRAAEWSDIDLAVVSPDFSDDAFGERLALMQLALQIDDRIEPHPFLPEDFTINDPLVCEIRRSGIRVRFRIRHSAFDRALAFLPTPDS